MTYENVLGVNVTNQTGQKLLKFIEHRIDRCEKTFICAINPEKIITARENQEIQQILDSADICLPDGIGIVKASKILGGSISQRQTGIETMIELCELANSRQLRVFFYGGAPEVQSGLIDVISSRFPNLIIAGHCDGFQSEENVESAFQAAKSGDVCFVALGSPAQERWIMKNMDSVSFTIFQGVGGSFDVISGKIPRSPQWVQRMGLEWLYRLLNNPTRWKRQLKLIKFLSLVFKQKLSRRLEL